MANGSLKFNFSYEPSFAHEVESLLASSDFPPEHLARFQDCLVDLIDSGGVFKLEAVATGAAGEFTLNLVGSDAYRALVAALRAGDLNELGAGHG